jgi:hypothetical protein
MCGGGFMFLQYNSVQAAAAAARLHTQEEIYDYNPFSRFMHTHMPYFTIARASFQCVCMHVSLFHN